MTAVGVLEAFDPKSFALIKREDHEFSPMLCEAT